MVNPAIPEFEKYLRTPEPLQRERAEAWRIAIGLQAVDGLTVSDFLKHTAQQHIEGLIDIDEAGRRIKTYYQTKTNRETDDDDKQEADTVSRNITKLLGEQSFTFSVAGLAAIHRQIFSGVFKHAGKFRQYDITKKEWVLDGDTVLYSRWQDLRMTLAYDLEQEKQFDYSALSVAEMVEHLAGFVSGLWQIHPFSEGNTRTTAIFTIKYLRSIGFQHVNNDLFEQHSWYLRNALVRANYRNLKKAINPDNRFLVAFFRNLLLNENNPLHNRIMHISWQEPTEEQLPSTPTSTPTSTGQVQDMSPIISSETIDRVVRALGRSEMPIKDLMLAVGLKDRKNFIEYSLNPAIRQGFVQMLYPDSPRHPRQKYLLTVKGQLLYNELITHSADQ